MLRSDHQHHPLETNLSNLNEFKQLQQTQMSNGGVVPNGGVMPNGGIIPNGGIMPNAGVMPNGNAVQFPPNGVLPNGAVGSSQESL